MKKNCFLCRKSNVDERFSSDSNSRENCIILCQILNLPHFGNNTKKFETVNYCYTCTTRIWKMKHLLEELDKLKKHVWKEKYLIRLKLEENYQNNIGNEFSNSTDLFGLELVNEWKLKSIKLKMAKIERKRFDSKAYCWKRIKGLQIMRNVKIYKNLEQEVVDGHNILKLPNSDKSISPLFSNFISVDALNEREDLSFLDAKPDIGELDMSGIFTDSQVRDDVLPTLTTNMLEFEDIKFEPFICEHNKPTDVKDPLEGTGPESNSDIQSNDMAGALKHIEEEAFKCRYCEKVFCTLEEERTHECTHSDRKFYNRKYYKKVFTYPNNVIYPQHLQERKKHYECTLCKKSYMSARNLRRHQLTHTSLFRRYKCKYCENTFRTLVEMRAHERLHTGDKPFNCKYCEKVFAQLRDLRTHERVHTGEKPYECEYCKKTFSHRGSWKGHIQRLHTIDLPYQCGFCVQKFNIQNELEKHERFHTGEKPHSCKYCGKVFRLLRDLKSHEIVHTGKKPFNCQYCDGTFTRKDNCRDHELLIHTSKITVG